MMLYMCSGSNGMASLVSVAVEPPGLHCPAGGSVVSSGIDQNANTVLEPGEITSHAYVCSGATSGAVGYLQRLLGSPPEPNRMLGQTASQDQDTLVLTGASIGTTPRPVFVFDRSPVTGSWSFTTSITIPQVPGSEAAWHGVVHGNVIAITEKSSVEASGSGSVYVYERSTSTGPWAFAQKLVSGTSDNSFGQDVALGNDLIASISRQHIFLFSKNPTTGVWDPATPIPLPADGSDYLSIAVSGNTLALGGLTTAPSPHGTVWVFEKTIATGVWVLVQEVLPSFCCPTPSVSVAYGQVLSLDNDRMAIGDLGSVWVFDRVIGSGWQLHGALHPLGYFSFGGAVIVRGGLIVASAASDMTGGAAAHVFKLDPLAGWVDVQRIQPPNQVIDSYSSAFALDNTQLIITAPSHDELNAADVGGADIYSITP